MSFQNKFVAIKIFKWLLFTFRDSQSELRVITGEVGARSPACKPNEKLMQIDTNRVESGTVNKRDKNFEKFHCFTTNHQKITGIINKSLISPPEV